MISDNVVTTDTRLTDAAPAGNYNPGMGHLSQLNTMKTKTSFEQLYEAARKTIETQKRYITELEKQLEHTQPGLVEEVREFLEQENKQ